MILSILLGIAIGMILHYRKKYLALVPDKGHWCNYESFELVKWSRLNLERMSMTFKCPVCQKLWQAEYVSADWMMNGKMVNGELFRWLCIQRDLVRTR